MAKLVGVIFYAALAFFLLAFIFANRATVALDLFPIAATAELPLYVALCGVFLAGLLIGLLYAATLWVAMQRKLKRCQRAVMQLEKAIAP